MIKMDGTNFLSRFVFRLLWNSHRSRLGDNEEEEEEEEEEEASVTQECFSLEFEQNQELFLLLPSSYNPLEQFFYFLKFMFQKQFVLFLAS